MTDIERLARDLRTLAQYIESVETGDTPYYLQDEVAVLGLRAHAIADRAEVLSKEAS